jgi:cytochrome c5
MLRAQAPLEVGGANRNNSLPEGDGKALVLGTCTQCHSLGAIVLQRKSAAQWGKTVSDMISRGAQIRPDEIAPISNYLAHGFGPDAPLSGAASEKTAAPQNVSAARSERIATDAFPDGSAKVVILRSCSECHGLSKITAQNKDEAGWLASLKDMVRLGAQLRPEEVTVVAAYLAKNFGRTASTSATVTSGVGPVGGASGKSAATSARSADLSRLLPDGEGKGLVLASCVQCHSLQEITGQRKGAEDWKRTVHDMVSRGAQVSWPEAELIATYLAERLGK